MNELRCSKIELDLEISLVYFSQNRHDEFIKLEKSITEVRDMFFEVAQLVQEQGEMVGELSYLIFNSYNIQDFRLRFRLCEEHFLFLFLCCLSCLLLGHT